MCPLSQPHTVYSSVFFSLKEGQEKEAKDAFLAYRGRETPAGARWMDMHCTEPPDLLLVFIDTAIGDSRPL